MAAPNAPKDSIGNEDLEKIDDDNLNQLAKDNWNDDREQPEFKLSRLEQFFRKIFNSDVAAASDPKGKDVEWLTDEEYKKKANAAVKESWRILNGKGWKLERKGDQADDLIESLLTEEYGKVYKLTATIDAPPDFLLEVIFKRFEDMSKWNPSIIEGKIIKPIDARTDIVYQVTAGGGGGIVAPRDFVTLRQFARIDSDGRVAVGHDSDGAGANEAPLAFVSAGVSVEVPGWPPSAKYVRGDNMVGCWATRPVMTADGRLDSSKLVFHWLMGINLKGRIPQFILDTALSTAMKQFLGHLRAYLQSNRELRPISSFEDSRE